MLSLTPTSSVKKSASASHLNTITQPCLRRTVSSPALLKSGNTLSHILKTISFIPKGQTEKRTCTIEHVNLNNKKDMEQIFALYKKSMLANKEGFLWNTDPKKLIPDILKGRENFPATMFAVARDDKGDIVGFGTLTASTDKFKDKDGKSIYPPDEAEGGRFHVDQNKGKDCGYGIKLLQTVLEHAKKHGIKNMNIRVTLTQERAITLYHKLGFKIDERFKNVLLPPPRKRIEGEELARFSHIKGAKNAFVYKTPVQPEDEVAEMFKGTELEKLQNDLRDKKGFREFPTLHFHFNVNDLLNNIKDETRVKDVFIRSRL